jgi:sulfate adenylyltransferase subunit 1
MEDQIEALERSADITGGGQINLANLTDGLRAEREQGITIDVAYRYFATPRRKFIIADTPGHVQYTRNMVTGASAPTSPSCWSTPALGVIEQSRRHTCIASLLRIPHLVVAVNKMDLVGWSEERFDRDPRQFEEFLPRLDIKDVKFIPISALNGDNVVEPSRTPRGIPAPDAARPPRDRAHRQRLEPQRLPPARAVGQPPERPTDPRCTTSAASAARSPAASCASARRSSPCPRPRQPREGNLDLRRPVEEAFCPQSVTLVLEHDIDVSRGDMIIGVDNLPGASTDLHAKVCWMHPRPLQRGKKYFLKHTTHTVQALVTEIEHRIDITTLEPSPRPPSWPSTISAKSACAPPSRSSSTATRPTG